MSSGDNLKNRNVDEFLKKVRDERMAREKARIERLREMNLKKYNKNEPQASTSGNVANARSAKPFRSNSVTYIRNDIVRPLKNNFSVNGTTKRPITAPPVKKTNKVQEKVVKSSNPVEKKVEAKSVAITIPKDFKPPTNLQPQTSKVQVANEPLHKDLSTQTDNATAQSTRQVKASTEIKVLKEIPNTFVRNLSNDLKSRKSFVVPSKGFTDKPKPLARKSMLPKFPETKSESVFERLYKPKIAPKNTEEKVHEPNLLKKAVQNAGLRRYTCFENNAGPIALPRRSISAIHLKRLTKSELPKCIHKWTSVGDKLNNAELEINEDDQIVEDKIVSAVKSERKKVKFMTPTASNFNTPRPEELQSRLKSWLQKRGKSIDSYHHLQCFGLHHMKSQLGTPKNLNKVLKPDLYDEENKENVALDSVSDDGSYTELMSDGKDTLSSGDKIDIHNWRRASFDSESVGFDESRNFNDTTLTSADTVGNVDELLIGALNDLTELLREGFEWQQSARWLRSIRSRFPEAPRTAAYWECRAALEDARGDLPASVHCWEQAVAKGTEHSVVEANLDQLLDKFMQLKISPKTGAPKQPNPKLVDVKNVFKSTIIRFAVQQAKLRKQSETPLVTVTPVRRSARLSHCPKNNTPLRVCDSVKQAAKWAPQHVFTPNDNLVQTP